MMHDASWYAVYDIRGRVTAQPVILSEARNLVCAKNETLRFAQGDTKSVQIRQG